MATMEQILAIRSLEEALALGAKPVHSLPERAEFKGSKAKKSPGILGTARKRSQKHQCLCGKKTCPISYTVTGDQERERHRHFLAATKELRESHQLNIFAHSTAHDYLKFEESELLSEGAKALVRSAKVAALGFLPWVSQRWAENQYSKQVKRIGQEFFITFDEQHSWCKLPVTGSVAKR